MFIVYRKFTIDILCLQIFLCFFYRGTKFFYFLIVNLLFCSLLLLVLNNFLNAELRLENEDKDIYFLVSKSVTSLTTEFLSTLILTLLSISIINAFSFTSVIFP